jgi:hypothetical protein
MSLLWPLHEVENVINEYLYFPLRLRLTSECGGSMLILNGVSFVQPCKLGDQAFVNEEGRSMVEVLSFSGNVLSNNSAILMI